MNNLKIRFISITVLCFLLFSPALVKAEKSWKAKWISTDRSQSATNTWLAYRKIIDIQEIPEKAISKIAVDSKYWLWINGKLVVFEGGLKRAVNPFDTYYDEVDIAPFLQSGENSIAVLVWYFGKDGFSHQSSGRAGLIFDCQAAGFELFSDNTWNCGVINSYQVAGEPFPNYRLPESSILYDARKDIGPWQTDKTIRLGGAVVIGNAGDYPWNKLVKRPIPLFKDFGLTNYPKQNIPIASLGFDTIVCELPYNAQITPYLKVDAPEGMKITIATDNYLFYKGDGLADGIRAEYITKNGIQEYESLGWMNGHKVYYIIPKGVKVLELKYRESGYDTEFAGSFHCSDPFFNTLWEKARRTLYITMRDSYMDCPDRERALWTGDAVNEAGEAFYALCPSSHALARNWLSQMFGWQKPNGVLYSPFGNWKRELPGQILATIGYYGLWTYYKYTGDKQILIDYYDGANRYLNLWEPDGKGTMEMRMGKMHHWGHEHWTWGDWGENKDMLLLYNLWYYLAIKGMNNAAVELGKTDDVARYTQFMTDFKTSFNQQFWNGTAYRDPEYQGETDDRAQALAVVSGVADPDKFPALLRIFQTEEHASPYMEKYVFEAMMQMGYEKEAMKRHQKRFAPMVNHPDFTTLFEGWGIGTEGFGGGTVNHAWSGGGLTILSQYVCGIAPLKPGFEMFQVMPQPGHLTEASTSLESVKGFISTSFKKQASRMEIKVSVPASTNAVVGVPAQGVKRIRLNGKLVWQNGKYLRNNGTSAQVPASRIGFDVAQGEWTFTAEY